MMTVFNVSVPVVELVEADSEQEAITSLCDAVRTALIGTRFQVSDYLSTAFESED